MVMMKPSSDVFAPRTCQNSRTRATTPSSGRICFHVAGMKRFCRPSSLSMRYRQNRLTSVIAKPSHMAAYLATVGEDVNRELMSTLTLRPSSVRAWTVAGSSSSSV